MKHTTSLNKSCKLKLDIDVKLVNEINQDLVKDVEMSGVVYCNDDNTIRSIKKNTGTAESVYTPNNVINFHTHPISAYNNGGTVWGWPSGEDMRETLKFALAGNKAHLVFTVEGVYTIQVNPCKLTKMKELLTETERGILIFIIEEYFKTTHNFRGVSEVNGMARKKHFINPYSFVDFANTFSLEKILCNKTNHEINPEISTIDTIGHTGIHSEENIHKYSFGNQPFTRIPSFGFPEIDSNSISTLSLQEYLTSDTLKHLRKISASGVEYDLKLSKKEVLEQIKIICAKIENIDCAIPWNNKSNISWFFVNFFPSNNFKTKKHYLNKYITPSLKHSVSLHYNPFIRIFSNQKEGCSINTIAKKNNFI